ncbi:hypothetical protein CDV36_012525 [Fusarium kuroshium]|uniref:Fungal N-terminal domain-containing protein n=2 Tax=Fusarium solani species complex TaxID=232080 RepID=A0A3M2RRC3_9HYPO|nr:hypothetical protein CDV36_012525 [Fusarium kuroshium]RSL89939.1 hypothetical protein CEP51_001011 [Fusarium floridanum]
MAEVLGIVAGAAQLLDLSTRVLVASSSLYGKLKNIPNEIETLKKNTELFIDLLWMISSDFDGPINSQVHSLHVTHRITSILHDAKQESEELALLLEGLSSNNSSSARRKWSAVVSATKEKDIAERCRRIESFKSTLQLWYQHQSNARLRRVEHQLSQVTVSQEAAHTSMSLIAHQARRTSAVIDSNRAIVKRLDSHEDPAPSLEHRRRRPRRNATLCTCRPSGSRAFLSIYGLQLFYSQEASHLPNCPHRDGSISWSCGVRALSPKIQMMVGIQLGGWTLSMVGGLSPHNIVDPKKSPAFIALREAERNLLGWRRRIASEREYHQLALSSAETNRQEEVKALFNTLLQKLREAFESGSASPGDYTADNFHALHNFVVLAVMFAHLHEHLSGVLNDTVELLVAGNADISHRDPVYTPLYYMLLYLAITVPVKNNKLDTILINHGCMTSQSVVDTARDPSFVTMFRKNPSLLEGHGQYLAHAAAIQRSETELGRLLRQNKIDLRTTTPSILSLAVGWTTGLQILLDAGANPNDAILTAIYEDHLPSIELLVDNGCSFFDLDHYRLSYIKASKADALFFATSLPASSDVVCLLVQKLVERRLQLLQLATKELPEAYLKRLGLHKQQHVQPSPDYDALEVFRQLEAHKVQVPMALWPGSLTNLYHHPNMTDTLAERLYDAGFRRIDELDEHGRSPLMKTILEFSPKTSMPLTRWYLRKGCQLPRSLAYVDFLDQAKMFRESLPIIVWITKDSRLCGFLRIFQELHPEGVEQRDSCSCWCSTSGCTPVGIILRTYPLHSQLESFIDRRRWLFNLARYSCLGLSLDKDTFADICRLEVFDRLGMAHTCSDYHYHYQCNNYHSDDECYSGSDSGDDDSSEQGEIQEEDRYLKQALDSYLELYFCLLDTYADRFEAFWVAWWIALEYFLPFETSSGEHSYHPVNLGNVCDPQSYDEAQSHESYEPNVEAITAFLADCIPQLSSETRANFFGQFEPTEDELRILMFRYPLPYDEASLIDDI